MLYNIPNLNMTTLFSYCKKTTFKGNKILSSWAFLGAFNLLYIQTLCLIRVNICHEWKTLQKPIYYVQDVCPVCQRDHRISLYSYINHTVLMKEWDFLLSSIKSDFFVCIHWLYAFALVLLFWTVIIKRQILRAYKANNRQCEASIKHDRWPQL